MKMCLSHFLIAWFAVSAVVSQDCVMDPSNHNCVNYEYPLARSNVALMCQVSNMPGCSLDTACSAGASGPYCTPMSVLGDLCTDMPGMNPCMNYTMLCGHGSVVKACTDPGPLPGLPSTMDVMNYITDICNSMPGMAGCSTCNPPGGDCDLLTVYSSLCNDMSMMSNCSAWRTMCQYVPSWDFCGGQTDCIALPQDTRCAGYQYPWGGSDVADLCSSMPMMATCTLDKACAAHAGDPYCAPLSLLADACVVDGMGMMGGCSNYTTMCQADTAVTACGANKALPGLPSTSTVAGYVTSICAEMSMSACCPDMNNCDVLTSYSQLCMSMPDMSQCASWKTICNAIPSWSEFCPVAGAPNQPPPMRMYFHLGIDDYILFKSWVPRGGGQYFGAMFAVACFAAAFEGLQSVRAVMERRWQKQLRQKYQNLEADATQPFRCPVEFARASLHMLEVGLGFLLMLVVMTYNVGLFLSVLFGYFVGHFAFARFRIYEARPACCS